MTKAVEILHHRYIKGDPKREASLRAERLNAEVALLIHGLRRDAGLSQEELADLVETTQSVISRLEDTDYDGHSLFMLQRITDALGYKLIVGVVSQEANVPEVE